MSGNQIGRVNLLSASGNSSSITIGQTYSGAIATVIPFDPLTRPSDLEAVINWGDGTSSGGVITGNTENGFSVTGTHTYTQIGTDNATVTVTNVNNPLNLGVAPSTVSVDALVTVTPAAATHFSIGTSGAVTAGTAFNATVTALDPFNNTATGYSGTVHFASTDGQAILPANATLTNGVGTFSVTFKTASSQFLIVTDTMASALSGIAATTVSAAATAHFSVSAPASITGGTPFNFSVTAEDAFNNTVTGYSGTVHFTSSDSVASIPANASLSNGVGTFVTTLFNAGNRALTATDTITASITGSTTLSVLPDAAPTFIMSTPASAVVGTPFTFTVTTHGFPSPSLTESGLLPAGVTFADNHDGTAMLSGTPAAGTGNTYTFSITANNAFGPAVTQSFILTVNEAPAITTQPNSQTITAGNAVTFTAGGWRPDAHSAVGDQQRRRH